MQWLASLCIRQPVLTWVLMLVFIVVGVALAIVLRQERIGRHIVAVQIALVALVQAIEVTLLTFGYIWIALLCHSVVAHLCLGGWYTLLRESIECKRDGRDKQ